MNYSIFIILLATLLGFSLPVNAQPDTWSQPKEKVFISGVPYYKHTVAKGESLYSISRQYGVSQRDIAQTNPEVYQGVSKGQVLYVPILDDASASASASASANDKTMLHTVLPGETLFTIADVYHVRATDILTLNPDLSGNPIPGTTVKIPTGKINFAQTAQPDSSASYIYHLVEKNQTLYFLHKKYDVEVSDIIQANPGVENGLELGQVVRIPVYVHDFGTIKVIRDSSLYAPSFFNLDSLYPMVDGSGAGMPCKKFDYRAFDRPFRIAILLPFYINDNKKANVFDNVPASQKRYYGNTKIMLHFYEGVLLAVDAMRKNGMDVELYTYDTERDENKVQDIMQRQEMKTMDLIIGPVYSNTFKIASDFAKQNEITIVSPLSQNASVLTFNPYVFQGSPSERTQVEQASRFLAQYYYKNIVLLHNGSDDELKLVELYKQELGRAFGYFTQDDQVVYKDVDYRVRGLKGLEDALSVGVENIVILPSDNEVFVTDVVMRLDTLNRKYKINLFGMESWHKFLNVNIQSLYNLNFNYYSSSYVDYSSQNTKSFVRRFRDVYGTEPNQFSFQGYDITYYFLNALKRYGPDFMYCISPYDVVPNRKGLHSEFSFIRQSAFGGFENKSVYILGYDRMFNVVRHSVPSQGLPSLQTQE